MESNCAVFLKFKRPVGVLGTWGPITKVMTTLDPCGPGELVYLGKEYCGLA